MSYCAYTDVQNEFKDATFSSSTAIKTAQVTEFISQADALIDGRIGSVYVTPVTGTESVKILKMISIGLVATRIKNILAVKTGSEKVEQGSEVTVNPYEKMLNMIVKGDLVLSDATKVQAGNGLSAGTSSASCCEPHVFEKCEDQW